MFYIELAGDIARLEEKKFLFLKSENRVIDYLNKIMPFIDVEDDRVKVWKLEEVGLNIETTLIWGFFGWHWRVEMEQGYVLGKGGGPVTLAWPSSIYVSK